MSNHSPDVSANGKYPSRDTYQEAAIASRASIDVLLSMKRGKVTERQWRVMLAVLHEVGTYSRVSAKVSRARLAALTGYSVRTITTALNELAKMGAIEYSPNRAMVEGSFGTIGHVGSGVTKPKPTAAEPAENTKPIAGDPSNTKELQPTGKVYGKTPGKALTAAFGEPPTRAEVDHALDQLADAVAAHNADDGAALRKTSQRRPELRKACEHLLAHGWTADELTRAAVPKKPEWKVKVGSEPRRLLGWRLDQLKHVESPAERRVRQEQDDERAAAAAQQEAQRKAQAAEAERAFIEWAQARDAELDAEPTDVVAEMWAQLDPMWRRTGADAGLARALLRDVYVQQTGKEPAPAGAGRG